MAYRAMLSLWEYPDLIATGASEPETVFADDRYSNTVGGDEVAAMMLLDAAVYLQDDILAKVDRATMVRRAGIALSFARLPRV